MGDFYQIPIETEGNALAVDRGVGEVGVADVRAVLVDRRAGVGDEEHAADAETGNKKNKPRD